MSPGWQAEACPTIANADDLWDKLSACPGEPGSPLPAGQSERRKTGSSQFPGPIETPERTSGVLRLLPRPYDQRPPSRLASVTFLRKSSRGQAPGAVAWSSRYGVRRGSQLICFLHRLDEQQPVTPRRSPESRHSVGAAACGTNRVGITPLKCGAERGT